MESYYDVSTAGKAFCPPPSDFPPDYEASRCAEFGDALGERTFDSYDPGPRSFEARSETVVGYNRTRVYETTPGIYDVTFDSPRGARGAYDARFEAFPDSTPPATYEHASRATYEPGRRTAAEAYSSYAPPDPGNFDAVWPQPAGYSQPVFSRESSSPRPSSPESCTTASTAVTEYRGPDEAARQYDAYYQPNPSKWQPEPQSYVVATPPEGFSVSRPAYDTELPYAPRNAGPCHCHAASCCTPGRRSSPQKYPGGKRIGRPRIDRSNTRCERCGTQSTPQWRYLPTAALSVVVGRRAGPVHTEPPLQDLSKASKICLCNACWLRVHKSKQRRSPQHQHHYHQPIEYSSTPLPQFERNPPEYGATQAPETVPIPTYTQGYAPEVSSDPYGANPPPSHDFLPPQPPAAIGFNI